MQLLDMFNKVAQFNSAILGLDAPKEPIKLTADRKAWTVAALREEVQELEDAKTLEDQADALIDLLYFVLGRFHEMGIAYGQAFDDVHEANMTKHRGRLQKRPPSEVADALKPDGFQPPKHEQLSQLRVKHLIKAELYDAFPTVFKEITELAARKAKDYNGNDVKRADYFPFGDASYVQMLWTKVLRLRSLAGKPAALHESKRDSVIDLINYGRFYIEFLDGHQ